MRVFSASFSQVGSRRTFPLQVQPAGLCQCSTGQVVAEKTHRSLLPFCGPGGTPGILPVQELASPTHPTKQELKPWHLKGTRMTVSEGNRHFHLHIRLLCVCGAVNGEQRLPSPWTPSAFTRKCLIKSLLILTKSSSLRCISSHSKSGA